MPGRGHDHEVETVHGQPVAVAEAVVPGADGSNRGPGELAKTPGRLGVIEVAMGEQGQGNPRPATSHDVEHPLQMRLVERSGIDHDAAR